MTAAVLAYGEMKDGRKIINQAPLLQRGSIYLKSQRITAAMNFDF